MHKYKNFSVLILFSLTLFLSAALMFSLQPMIGKMLLPIVGGSPSGWMVALAFFQIMLLVGYYISHLLSRLSPFRQAVVYLGLICVGYLFLPVSMSRATLFVGAIPGPIEVLLLLTAMVAVPFVALSATSSTLQRLFMITDHPASGSPYFLYVASNLGSLGGLFLYPLYIEPSFGLKGQSGYWLLAYSLLIVAIMGCLLATRQNAGRQKPERKKAAEKEPPLNWRQNLTWIALSFVPASLMMGLTSYISAEIVSMPLLWVIPLGLYLAAFIIAFSNTKIVSLEWLSRVQPTLVVASILVIFVVPPHTFTLYDISSFHATAFTIISLMCLVALSELRPVNSERDLTLFYLMLAIGGALAGIFNALVVPLVLRSALEYPLILIASCFLNPHFRFRKSDVLFLAGILLVFAAMRYGYVPDMFILGVTIPLYVVVIVSGDPRIILAACSFVAMTSLQNKAASIVYQDRGFFGVLKIVDDTKYLNNGKKVRILYNGTTIHGMQYMDTAAQTEPTSYYTRKGPLGEVFSTLQPKRVAAVGLGAGTIACYGSPENNITFFEINAQDQLAAEKYFSFLDKCGTGPKPQIILGDARLSLDRMKDQKYDLIILDAFSGDAVPTHLLTKEATKMYLDHLTEHGVVLFHISNKHFRLQYPLAAISNELDLHNRYVSYDPKRESDLFALASVWVALSRDETALGKLSRLPWQPLPTTDVGLPWTDDYTNLLSVMHL